MHGLGSLHHTMQVSGGHGTQDFLKTWIAMQSLNISFLHRRAITKALRPSFQPSFQCLLFPDLKRDQAGN